MQHAIDLIRHFASDHPQVMALLVWPLVAALITAAFKPRTPEAYAALASRQPVWLFARVAALLQLIGALGIDPVKATEAVKKFVGGRSLPPPPLAILLVVTLAFGSSGCKLFTRENARTVLDVVQTACIIAHQDLPDSDVAKVCELTEPLLGPMREILAEARKQSAEHAADAAARAGAAKCVTP